MSGKVNRTLIFRGLALPSLPAEPSPSEVSELSDASMAPMKQILDDASLRMVEQKPDQLLQQNLGSIRKRVIDDPEGEGVQKTLESYWVRVESTTLSDVLLVESRIWTRMMEANNSALQKIAMRAYYRISQHEHYLMSRSELYMGSNALLAKIEKGDLGASREALSIYQGYLQRYYSKRPDLAAMEASLFRSIARGKIRRIFDQNQDGNIDAEMASHLNSLLAVYAQIIFLDGIDLLEIQDGVEWVELYMQDGHPLEHCAKEVRATLEMTKDYLEHDKTPPAKSAPVQDPTVGNLQDPESGVIDAQKNKKKMGRVGEVPDENAVKIIIAGDDD